MRYNGFIGPSYTLDSASIDSQRCVNLYPKMNEFGFGKSGEVASLMGTPGLRKALTLPTSPFRGIYRATNGFLYAVGGDKLYLISSSEAATELGTLATTTGAVSFSDNGSTLVLVDGPNGYWHTLSSSIITKFTGSAWRGSSTVNYIDGYFLFNDPATDIFYISSLDGIELDALDFSTSDGAPDNLLTTQVNHREIWLFGSDSIEGWYNSGNADFPFQRIGSGFIEVGCAAAFSVAKIDKTTLWLGQSKEGRGIVYAAQGFSPQRISTHAVELAIQSYGDISDAKAWTYQENGHSFYVLNFTNANTTWVYDLTTRLWHERAYLEKGAFQRHRADGHAFAYGKHYVGDYENGNIYELSSSVYLDDTQEIRRERIAPHLSESTLRIVHNSFELELESGVGITTGQGSSPQVMLQFSDDGGFSWSNEKWANAGAKGQKRKRVIWRCLGASRDRVYKIAISDPVKVALIGAELKLEGLSS